MKPHLILISAASGTGKTTLCEQLLLDYPDLCYSISCTTRAPRGEEEDGVDYYFVTPKRFQELVNENAFLEHATVHGNSYGTLIAPIRSAFQEGLSILLDIDVAGAAQVRQFLKTLPQDDPLRQNFIDIFILPPSIDELRNRLIGRGQDSLEVIERRMHNAEGEIARAQEYSHTIVNDVLEYALRELKTYIEYKDAVVGPDNPQCDIPPQHHCDCCHNEH